MDFFQPIPINDNNLLLMTDRLCILKKVVNGAPEGVKEICFEQTWIIKYFISDKICCVKTQTFPLLHSIISSWQIKKNNYINSPYQADIHHADVSFQFSFTSTVNIGINYANV